VRSYCRHFAVSNAHSDRTAAAMIARYAFHYHGARRCAVGEKAEAGSSGR
jgi:hypothetical protein